MTQQFKQLVSMVSVVCSLTVFVKPVSAAEKSVLLLIDDQAASYLGDLVRQYQTQLRGEGWRSKLQYFPRWTGSYATNDWPGINRISNYVAEAGCYALQIIGSAPPIITGSAAYDGHEQRCITTLWPYACSNIVYTDLTDWSMPGTVQGLPSLIATNVAGDGRPDQYYGALAHPMCVLDASRLTATSDTFTSGYLVGQVAQTAIDEGDALRRYMTNNLAYRRKLMSFPSTGQIVQGSTWLNSATITASNTLVAISVSGNSYAAVTNGWLYHSDYMMTLSPNWVDSSGNWTRVFWANVFKSYCYENANGQGFYRRLLFNSYTDGPLALVSGWSQGANSNQFIWLASSSCTTVADAVVYSVTRYGVCDFAFPLAGDVTLPILSSLTVGPKLGTQMGTLIVGSFQ